MVAGPKRFLFGKEKRPDRSKYPSAHNYYLDFIYNFGFIAFLPFLWIIYYTLRLVFLERDKIMERSDLLGLTIVVFLLIFVDNSMKVGLRQPYPGTITFFLWGVLVSRLSKFSRHEQLVQ